MKVQVKEILHLDYGVESVRTVQELYDYSKNLLDEYGGDTEISIGGYDFYECVTITRDERPDEFLKRKAWAHNKKLLKGNKHNTSVHKQIVEEFGYDYYQNLINEITKGEKNEKS